MKFTRYSKLTQVLKILLYAVIICLLCVSATYLINDFKNEKNSVLSYNEFFGFIVSFAVILGCVLLWAIIKTFIILALPKKSKKINDVQLNDENKFQDFIQSRKLTILKGILATIYAIAYIYCYIAIYVGQESEINVLTIILETLMIVVVLLFATKFWLTLSLKIFMNKNKDWYKMHIAYLFIAYHWFSFARIFKSSDSNNLNSDKLSIKGA